MTVLLGLGVVIATAILLLVLTFLGRKSLPAFRDIPAFTSLRRAAGLAVENGTRVHVSLGRSGLITTQCMAALSGLALLRQLGERTSISDRPPIATSGDATLAILSRDVLQTAYQAAGAEDLNQPANGRLSGLTPFSYAAGTMTVVQQEQISTSVLIGDFGPELALVTDASERENALLIAAASDPLAQSILFASVSDPLVGEELFAAPAYLGNDASHRASLQVQDVLRWLIILSLLAGAALKLAGLS